MDEKIDFENQLEQAQIDLKKEYISPIVIALDYSIEGNAGPGGDGGGGGVSLTAS